MRIERKGRKAKRSKYSVYLVLLKFEFSVGRGTWKASGWWEFLDVPHVPLFHVSGDFPRRFSLSLFFCFQDKE